MIQRDDDRHIQRVALYAILVNVALAALRGWLAHLSGSLAVVAVTIDAAIDVAAALLLWAGLKFSVRKTKNFPYGLYKLENVVQVVVAILIFLVGYEIVRQVLTSSGSPPASSAVVLAGMGFSTVAVLALSLYMAYEGRKTVSPGLLAEARHRWVDLAASAVVFWPSCQVTSVFPSTVRRPVWWRPSSSIPAGVFFAMG
jgi:cation diffusion facilitator family transporter